MRKTLHDDLCHFQYLTLLEDIAVLGCMMSERKESVMYWDKNSYWGALNGFCIIWTIFGYSMDLHLHGCFFGQPCNCPLSSAKTSPPGKIWFSRYSSLKVRFGLKFSKIRFKESLISREWLNPISYGGGHMAPPGVHRPKGQNWLGPEGQDFAAFILI